MIITFSPSVGEVRSIRSPSPYLSLNFTATFANPSEFEDVLSKNASLQLWTNLPGAGLSPGDWGSFDLARSTEHSNTFLLLSSPLPVPQNDSIVSYSFTYRLLHPSGEIEWLGTFDQNGVVQLAPSTSESLPFLDSWGTDTTSSFIYKTIEGQGTQTLKVPSSWAILHASELPYLVALVPPSVAGAAPATLILSAGTAACLTIKDSTIICSTSSSLKLQAVQDNVLNNLGIFNKYAFLGTFGLILAVPLFPLPSSSQHVQIPKVAINNLASASTKAVCLWNPSHGGFICDFEDATTHPDFVMDIPSTGARFLIHSIQSLNGTKVFLPAHASTTKADSISSLPTPPPSPRLRSSGIAAEPTVETTEQPVRVAQPSQTPPSPPAPTPPRARGIFSLVKRVIWTVLTMVAYILARLKFKKGDGRPSGRVSERTPLLVPETPEDSQPVSREVPKDAICVNVPKAELTILLFPAGRSKGLTMECEGQSLKPKKMSSMALHPLGEADVLSYQLSKPGSIKLMHS